MKEIGGYEEREKEGEEMTSEATQHNPNYRTNRKCTLRKQLKAATRPVMPASERSTHRTKAAQR